MSMEFFDDQSPQPKSRTSAFIGVGRWIVEGVIARTPLSGVLVDPRELGLQREAERKQAAATAIAAVMEHIAEVTGEPVAEPVPTDETI